MLLAMKCAQIDNYNSMNNWKDSMNNWKDSINDWKDSTIQNFHTHYVYPISLIIICLIK